MVIPSWHAVFLQRLRQQTIELVGIFAAVCSGEHPIFTREEMLAFICSNPSPYGKLFQGYICNLFSLVFCGITNNSDCGGDICLPEYMPALATLVESCLLIHSYTEIPLVDPVEWERKSSEECVQFTAQATMFFNRHGITIVPTVPRALPVIVVPW